MRRKPSNTGDPAVIRRAGSRASARRPIVYRTRRRTLRRLVIPAGLAAIMVGAAIGAAASYLTAPANTAPEHGQANRPAPSGRLPSSQPASTAVRSGATRLTTPSAGSHKSAPAPSSTTAHGEVLNDQGYALIQHTEYRAAIPLLRRAVSDLRGVGPTDPYEAYANYNLGYALLQVGDCSSALAPLQAANRLETSPLVDVAIRQAAACAGQGS